MPAHSAVAALELTNITPKAYSSVLGFPKQLAKIADSTGGSQSLSTLAHDVVCQPAIFIIRCVNLKEKNPPGPKTKSVQAIPPGMLNLHPKKNVNFHIEKRQIKNKCCDIFEIDIQRKLCIGFARNGV